MNYYGWLEVGGELGQGPYTRVYECTKNEVIKLMPYQTEEEFLRWQRGVQGRAMGRLTHQGCNYFFVVQARTLPVTGPLQADEARAFLEFSLKTLEQWNASNYRHGNLSPANLRKTATGWEFSDPGLHSPTGAHFPLPGEPMEDFDRWLKSVRELKLCEQNPQLKEYLDRPGLTFNQLVSLLSGMPERGWKPPLAQPSDNVVLEKPKGLFKKAVVSRQPPSGEAHVRPAQVIWGGKVSWKPAVSNPERLTLPRGHTFFGAISNSAGDVAMLDFTTGQSTLLSFKLGDGPDALAVSDDGLWLAASTGKEVELWSLRGAQRCGGLEEPTVQALAFTAEGELLCASRGCLLRWDRNSQICRQEAKETFVRVYSVDERGALGASRQGYQWAAWEASSSWHKGAEIGTYPRVGAWAPDYWAFYGPPPHFDDPVQGHGRRDMSGQPCSLYRVADDCRALIGNGVSIREIQIEPKSGLMVAADLNGLRLWDGRGNALGRYPVEKPLSPRWSADGSELFVLSEQKLLGFKRGYLLKNLQPVPVGLHLGVPQSFPLPQGAVLSGDGRCWAHLHDSYLEVRQLVGGQKLWGLEVAAPVDRLVLSRDGTQALAATSQGILLLSVGGARPLPECPGGACGLALDGLVWAAIWPGGQVRCGSHRFDRKQKGEGLCLSPGGRRLIVYGDHQLQVLDTHTWQGLHSAHYHCDTPPQVAHLGSERILRTTSNGLIWREALGKTNDCSTAHYPGLRAAHPDGAYLVAQHYDGTLHLLDSQGLHPLAHPPHTYPLEVVVATDHLTLLDSQNTAWIYPVQVELSLPTSSS